MRCLPILLACALLSICDLTHAQDKSDAPEEVLDLLERASGQWYVRVGNGAAACTVKSRANGRCVIVEGRRFADAISFTSLLGWYAPRRQVIGLIVFESGESLLVRAAVHRDSDKLTAEGDVVGVLAGKAVKANYAATISASAWSVKLQTDDGEAFQGHFRSTGR